MKNFRDIFFVGYKKRNKNVWVTKKLNNYLINLSRSRTTDDILEDYDALMRTELASYQTPLNQLEFITLLAKQNQTKKVLEIGTFKGFTSLYLAIELGKDSHVTTCELVKENLQVAMKLWTKHKVQDRITALEGNALDAIGLLKEKYDLIYIDADKNQYPAYYEVAKRLCRKDGLIILDNMLWAGLVGEEKSSYSHATLLRDLNRTIYKTNHSSVSMIPAWDGLLIVKG